MYYVFQGHNATRDRTDTSLISAVTLHIDIILATVPCAKPFFVVFEGGAFRSPTDPMNTTTGNSQSGPGTGGSGQPHGPHPARPRMPIRLPSHQALMMSRPAPSHQPHPMTTPTPSPQLSRPIPIIWDRRNSFAPASTPIQPPQPAAKAVTGRIGPWSFRSRRRITWVRRRSGAKSSAPSSPNGSNRSSRKSTTARFSSPFSSPFPSPFSSLRSTSSRQTRSELAPPREMSPRDHSQESRLSSRSHSRTRRQSEIDWFSDLRGEKTKTRTTICHDPDHAEEAARERSLGPEEAKRKRQSGIDKKQSFSVTSEAAPTPNESFSTARPAIHITPWAGDGWEDGY